MAKRTLKTSVQDQKYCPKCGRSLPLSQYYPNRKWKAQIYHDLWCKDCFNREAVDEDGLKKYCFENNREWLPELFDAAIRKATNYLSTKPQYVEAIPSEKEKMEWASTVKQFIALMNLAGFYHFVDNEVAYPGRPNTVSKEDQEKELEDAKQAVYSTRWKGYFTPKQIESLEEIYAQYERDFDLSDVSLQDYAMKVSKASFHADFVYDQMRRGNASISDYKEAQKIFDDLSKSANFAACRRKPGETTGMGSLGEIILRIEGTGKLNITGDVWPQDSVDAAINDFRHTIIAAGRDGVL